MAVPVRATNLDNSIAMAYCAYSRCGAEVVLAIFILPPILFLFSFTQTARY